jgi:hypothetical protein
MKSANRLSEAERVAEALGVILGAASCSEEVTEERLNSVTPKLRRLLSASATDAADAEAANERFSVALDAGRTAAEVGKIDPDDAEAALCEMEEQLAS